MRMTLITVVIAGLTLLPGTVQSAPTYPWCAVDTRSGTYTCIFVTPQQCLAYAFGLGYCVENPRIGVPDRHRYPLVYRG